MEHTILIIEDDATVAEGLKDILSDCGYRIYSAKNGKEAFVMLRAQEIHLILLDVMLGAESGYTLCKAIRAETEAPILFLTACSSELELIRGFQVGGDDYITKPFRMQELLVRIKALLRRSAKQSGEVLKTGALWVYPALHQVKKDSELLVLTATEWKIASALIEHSPQPLTRNELLYLVWDKDASFVEENTLSVNISRLREKLGQFEGCPYIETVRRVGYRWAAPVRR